VTSSGGTVKLSGTKAGGWSCVPMCHLYPGWRGRTGRARLGLAGGGVEGVSAGQDYLYVLARGLSPVVGYKIGHDGSRTQVTTRPGRRRLRWHRRQLNHPPKHTPPT
jgi:hypothetical protein